MHRNDEISLDEIERLAPDQIVISPGPCTPDEAGISMAVVRNFGPHVPTLGICLGHQSIGQVFGGTVTRARHVMHGKTSPIYHTKCGVFANLPNPFIATRYHSLIVEEPLPPALEVTAFTTEGEVMGLRHRHYPTFGVQFHPESILTTEGKRLLQNFLTNEVLLGLS